MIINTVKRFFGFIWQSLKAAQTLVFGLLSLVLIIAFVVALASRGAPKIPEGSALLLDLNGALVEQESVVAPGDLLLGADLPEEALIRDVVTALELAATDDRIGSVVLSTEGLADTMLPKLERVAKALEEFKTSGKPVIAVGRDYSQSAIYLAAHASEVLVNPEGSAVPEGFAMYRSYYKTLLDNFDVSINLFKVGKYKSAVEPFFRDDMSAEDRRARRAILDNWWGAYTEAVETARGLPADSIQSHLQNVTGLLHEVDGSLAQAALEMGLVDRVVDNNERRIYLQEIAGIDPESNEFQHTPYQAYLALNRKPETEHDNTVAVITASGAIVDGPSGPGTVGSHSLTELIRKARLDDKVKAIVLRVDSPGGSKSASEIIRAELATAQDAGIPVVASMGSIAASGGYWISATADEIWALPTTLTGSIGIFGLIPTFEKTLARYGIHSDGLSTTPLAGAASVERGISEEYGKLIQVVIEAGYAQFLDTVALGRNMTNMAVHEVAQGRVWSGTRAQELGLVDELGDLDQAIAAAADRAGLTDYQRWYVEPERTTEEMLIRELMGPGATAAKSASNPLAQLMAVVQRELSLIGQFNDPRGAYVLCADCPM